MSFITTSEYNPDLLIIIAGAGGVAHLPGMVASHTVLPVIIGAGRNAGLLALQILGTGDSVLRKTNGAYKSKIAAEARGKTKKLTTEVAEIQK